jgi:hypothetical protein
MIFLMVFKIKAILSVCLVLFRNDRLFVVKAKAEEKKLLKLLPNTEIAE